MTSTHPLGVSVFHQLGENLRQERAGLCAHMFVLVALDTACAAFENDNAAGWVVAVVGVATVISAVFSAVAGVDSPARQSAVDIERRPLRQSDRNPSCLGERWRLRVHVNTRRAAA